MLNLPISHVCLIPVRGGGGVQFICLWTESGQFVHMNCDPGVRGYGNQYHMTPIKRQKYKIRTNIYLFYLFTVKHNK